MWEIWGEPRLLPPFLHQADICPKLPCNSQNCLPGCVPMQPASACPVGEKLEQPWPSQPKALQHAFSLTGTPHRAAAPTTITLA